MVTHTNVQNAQQKTPLNHQLSFSSANTTEQTLCRFNMPLKCVRKGKIQSLLKAVTLINTVTGWFEVTQYKDKQAMTIENLVETMWIARYPWSSEITYDRVS